MVTRRSAVRLAGVAVASLAGCVGRSDDGSTDREGTDAGTVRGGTRTPTPGPETATPASERLRWRYGTAGRLHPDAGPVVSGRTVYAASDDLHAVVAGERRWRVVTDGERTCPPVRVADRLYALAGGPAGSDATLYALSTDGRVEWTRSVTETAGGPQVLASDAGAFVLGYEAPAELGTPAGPTRTATTNGYRPTSRYVVAFDPEGSERWRHEVGDVTGEWGVGLLDGVLYVHPPRTTDLYAFDAASGEVLWRFDRALYGPTVTPAGVFVVDPAGSLRAFGPDGTERWRFAPPAGSADFFAADGARAYLTAAAGDDRSDRTAWLYAVDADGRERWRVRSPGARFGQPVPADSTVYAGGFGGRVHAFDDADGSERWVTPTAGERTTSPVVGSDSVYSYELAHNDLFAVDAATGEVRWRFSPGSIPALANGRAYVGAANGTLYALSA